MKIGILALSHPGLGGTFQYTLSMIEALKHLTQLELTIYTVDGNSHYDNLGVPVRRVPSTLSNIARGLLTRVFRLRSAGLFKEVDKVIAPIYSTRLLASRRPFAFTLHDLQERYYPENFTFAQRTWRFWSNYLLARSASVIICESNYVKSDIAKFLPARPDRIAVIPAPPMSAFDESQLTSERLLQVRRKLQLPEEYVFYPSQFFPHKNHVRLVEAFSLVRQRFPNCYLILTGHARYEHANVMRRAEELSVAKFVRHMGYLETEDLAALYRLARCVAVPTLFESISIPVYEAFTLGAPVAASNVVALPEQIGDAGLLFDPTNVDEIADSVSRILADPELARALVARGRAKIAEFTMRRYSFELRDVALQI